MRVWRVGLVALLLGLGLGAEVAADEVAVLTVGFGEAPPALLGASVLRAVGGLDEVAIIETDIVSARVAARFPEPTAVDADWVAAQAIRGEEAYYAMDYGAAAAVFESDGWRAAQAAIVAMARDPALSDSLRRGLMIRAGSRFYAGDSAQAEAAMRDLIALFPDWTPDTDWYQPELVVAYTDVRHDVLRDAAEISLSAPRGDSLFSLNGLELGQGSVASCAALDRSYAVVVQSGDLTSRVHVVGAGEALIDPAFDAAFDPSAGFVVLSEASADRADELVAVARAWADVVGAERVVMAGVAPTGELQLMEIGTADGEEIRAVRASPDEGGAFDVPGALAALWDGTDLAGVEVAERDDDRLAFPGAPAPDDGDGGSVAPWIAFGVGGAGLIVGTAFAVVEGSRYDDFTVCRQDPVCASSPQLDSLEADRDRAAMWATVGFGVGLAGVITGAVLLILEAGDEDLPSDTAGRPRVTGAVSASGGWLGLGLAW